MLCWLCVSPAPQSLPSSLPRPSSPRDFRARHRYAPFYATLSLSRLVLGPLAGPLLLVRADRWSIYIPHRTVHLTSTRLIIFFSRRIDSYHYGHSPNTVVLIFDICQILLAL